MKKITLSLLLVLAMVMGSYGQISYNYGWEPTGLGNWLSVGTSGAFSRNVTTPCDGLASVRANIYGGNATTLTSPSIGTSNGGTVQLSFNYKVSKYSSNTTGADANEFVLTTEWANSSSGPWYTAGVIDEQNHQVSATCTTMIYNFPAFPGNMFIRFKAKSNSVLNNLYFYFDTVSVTQGSAPACLSPSVVTVTSSSSTSAYLSWNAISPAPVGGYQYSYSQTDGTPFTDGTATNVPSASFTNLLPDTTYNFWVRSMCAGSESAWYGPFAFKTLCASFAVPLLETFEADSDTEHCWTVINANGDAQAWNMSYTASPITGNQSASLNTANTASTNDDWLISPRIVLTGTQRLKFKYRAFNPAKPNDFMVKLSTTGNSPADFTTVLMPLTVASSFDPITKTISLTNYTGEVYIAFHVPPGGLVGSRLFIDDVLFEVSPAVVPECLAVLNTVASATCGNYPTTFEWEPVSQADGYRISIGTEPNGQSLVLNNFDLGSALNYSYIGIPGTTYYYTIKPYAGNLTAVNCFEDSFTTAANGCYCAAVPTSKDGGGISAVQIGSTTVAVGTPTYFSFVPDGAIDITKGVPTPMNVTLSTGYAYGTNIWIDFNKNYIFEPSEIVFSGSSTAQNPTILNTSFTVPITVATGEYNMRIVAKFGSATPANPCYNGEFGAVTDFLVNVLQPPTCVPPTQNIVSAITANTVQLSWTSTANAFNIQYDFAGFILGSGTMISDISGSGTTLSNLVAQSDYSYYIQSKCNAVDASVWAGPYTFRTGCAPFGSFTEDFTTSTDRTSPECWSTIVNSTDAYANVKNSASTDNMVFLNGADIGAGLYLITPALTDLVLNTHVLKFKVYSTSTNTSLVVGTMSDAANVATFTPIQTIAMPTSYVGTYTEFAIPMTNINTAMHIAFKYVTTNTFQSGYLDDIIWESNALSSQNFEINSLQVYPNPVKDMLNISFTQDISDLAIYNLLGQQVLFMTMNANKGQVDMSNLASGTYMIKVVSKNAVKTIKLIKE